jgi:pyocin large subunit-like protein
VHNLTVAGLHTYFVVVGDAPSLVHNCGAGWGNPATLTKHFDDHADDFGFESSAEYVSGAQNFLVRSQVDDLPTKIDANGIIRVYEPSTNTFGAYNPDGSIRTLFKPTSPTYWVRQPGDPPVLFGR